MNSTVERKSLGLRPVPQPALPTSIGDYLADDERRKAQASEDYRACLLSGTHPTRAQFDDWQRLLGVTPTQMADDTRLAASYISVEKTITPDDEIAQLQKSMTNAAGRMKVVRLKCEEMLQESQREFDAAASAYRGTADSNQSRRDRLLRIRLGAPRLWPDQPRQQ